MVNIVIPQSVKVIGESAFHYCSGLKSVEMFGVRTIDSYAFASCTNLETIVLPKSLSRIEAYAYKDCSSLKTVKYMGSSSQWNQVNKGTSGNSYLYNAEKIYEYVG